MSEENIFSVNPVLAYFAEQRKHPHFKVHPALLCLFTVNTGDGEHAISFKPAQGEIFNISENGLKLATNLILPVHKNLEATVLFELGYCTFQRKVRLLYHQEGIPPTYGASFVDILDKGEEIRFARALSIIRKKYGFGLYFTLGDKIPKEEK